MTNENKLNLHIITDQLSTVTKSNYSQALKLLGFITFIGNEGSETLQSRKYISNQTYNRYMTLIRNAGLSDWLLDIRMRQILVEMIETRLGGFDVDNLHGKVIQEISETMESISSHPSVARSPSAKA